MYQDLSQKIWGLQVREWRRVGQEWGTFEKLSVLVTFSPSQAGFKTLYPIKMYDLDLDENFCRVDSRSRHTCYLYTLLELCISRI